MWLDELDDDTTITSAAFNSTTPASTTQKGKNSTILTTSRCKIANELGTLQLFPVNYFQ